MERSGLDGVVVGDEVTVFYQGKPLVIRKVTSVTKTQFVTDHGDRWIKRTGRRLGDVRGHWGSSIVRCTIDDDRDDIERESLVSMLSDNDPIVRRRVLEGVSLETLRKCRDLVNEIRSLVDKEVDGR